jgi:phosphoribosylformylglycinamidine (FGAM) synthase-like amidotransferase family enzyme
MGSSLFKIRNIGFLSILLVISLLFILNYGNNDKIETDANKQDNITPISRSLQTKEGRIKLEQEILKFKKIAGKNRNETNTTIEKKSESNQNLNELDGKFKKMKKFLISYPHPKNFFQSYHQRSHK